MTEFGDELARLMGLRCIGVRKLAGQVPCNPGHVSNLRNGRGNPSSQMAARLDELLDAGGALSRLISPDYHRDRGVYLAREAAAYAGAGEADHAAGIGLQALAIGTETRSGRIFTELATVESRLDRTAASPAVREFTDAMNTVVLSTAATKGTP